MQLQRTVALAALSVALAVPALVQARDDDRAQQNRSSENIRFRGMDADNDGVITRAEWRGNDQSFREQDANGDGVLSGEEVRPRGNGQVRRRRDAQQPEITARLRAMDSDNDGVITRAEWQGTAQSFRQEDANSDGVLSGNEVWSSQTADRPDRNRRGEFAARFERADRDRDGRLTREEWPGNDTSFARRDLNRDMVITFDEFLAVVADQPTGTAGTAASRAATRAYQTGYDKGIIEGRDAGRADKGVNGGTWDLEGQRELEQADSGYRQELGARQDYQAGYRAGFRVGYREGFGPRR
jgi:Ca2+-binding EF-hand superfamily protein